MNSETKMNSVYPSSITYEFEEDMMIASGDGKKLLIIPMGSFLEQPFQTLSLFARFICIYTRIPYMNYECAAQILLLHAPDNLLQKYLTYINEYVDIKWLKYEREEIRLGKEIQRLEKEMAEKEGNQNE